MSYLRLITILMIGLVSSCTTESERILSEKIANGNFSFNNLKKSDGNIEYDVKDGIQYGLINMENGEKIKFWFLTHHATSDIGGTIYEFPDGESVFCSGLHCCEIQFYQNGRLGKKFMNQEEFKGYVLERNGIRP